MTLVLELTPITGAQLKRRLTTTGRLTKIGSSSSNDLVMQERQIEPRHAEIHQILDRFFVIPLVPNGRGISLNGLPVTSRSRLNPGDTLTLGVISYRLAITELLEQEVGSARSGQQVPRLGEYFIRRNLMNAENVAKVAKRQNDLERTNQRVAFGQLAYELGYISRSQLDAALADQRNDFNERFRD